MPDSRSMYLVAEKMIGVVAITLIATAAGLSYKESASLRADMESVCISLTVIGSGSVDPGTSYCNPPTVFESSSSSSSSSSASSTTSSIASSPSSADGEEPDDGARRGTIEQSNSKIIRLIRRWTRRNTLHAAPEPPREWYQDAVDLLRKRGYIDDTENLRLDADATRAEMAKLMSLFSGSTLDVPDVVSFDDAIAGSWYVPFIERAAKNSWMLGYDNCYGERPCYFRPGAVITRAEAAAVFVRVFHLQPSYEAPLFKDVPGYAWYRVPVQAAADACILRGNNEYVRPDALMTRAELFVMFARALAHDTYGNDCNDNVVTSTSILDNALDTREPSDVPEGELCVGFAGMCLLRAAASDVQTLLVNPLLGMLSSLDPRALAHVPAAEGAAWLVFIGIPLLCVFLLMKIGRYVRSKPVSHL